MDWRGGSTHSCRPRPTAGAPARGGTRAGGAAHPYPPVHKEPPLRCLASEFRPPGHARSGRRFAASNSAPGADPAYRNPRDRSCHVERAAFLLTLERRPCTREAPPVTFLLGPIRFGARPKYWIQWCPRVAPVATAAHEFVAYVPCARAVLRGD